MRNMNVELEAFRNDSLTNEIQNDLRRDVRKRKDNKPIERNTRKG